MLDTYISRAYHSPHKGYLLGISECHSDSHDVMAQWHIAIFLLLIAVRKAIHSCYHSRVAAYIANQTGPNNDDTYVSLFGSPPG